MIKKGAHDWDAALFTLCLGFSKQATSDSKISKNYNNYVDIYKLLISNGACYENVIKRFGKGVGELELSKTLGFFEGFVYSCTTNPTGTIKKWNTFIKF